MEMELSQDTIDKLAKATARAAALAPYEIVTEGVAAWSDHSKELFAKETDGKPIAAQLDTYLAMRETALDLVQREADAQAKQQAAQDAAIKERHENETATIEANKVQNKANRTSYEAALSNAQRNGLALPMEPRMLPETSEELSNSNRPAKYRI